MIKPINQICTACFGTGVVEGVKEEQRNPSNLLDNPGEIEVPRDEQPCYVCDGDGYIPSGLFIYEDTGDTFSTDLQSLDDVHKNAIMRKRRMP